MLENFAKELQRYFPDLEIKGLFVYRKIERPDGQETLEKIAQLGHEFVYNPQGSLVLNQEQFLRELRLALDIFCIYLTEVYKSAGLTLPPEKIIIEPPHEEVLSPIIPQTNEGLKVEFSSSEEIKERFGDVIGQEAAVSMMETIKAFIETPSLAEAQGRNYYRGIIFYGPPGTGKTTLARAIAGETQGDFLCVKLGDLTREAKWLGNLENNIQAIFDAAKRRHEETGRQVFIFFDEFEQLANAGPSHEAWEKVKRIIQTEMEGFTPSSGITVIAATNTLEEIDPAILSRFEMKVEFVMPEGEVLTDILIHHIAKFEQKKGRRFFFSSEENSFENDEIRKLLTGFSPREIRDLITLLINEEANRLNKEAKIRGVNLEEVEQQLKTSANEEERQQILERYGLAVKLTPEKLEELIPQTPLYRAAQKRLKGGRRLGFPI